ncbi:MAG: RNA polymerase sigma factor [Bacteroidota bacterium]
MIIQARAGDAQALDRLLREWYPPLMGFTRQYFQGRFPAEVAEELARDAVQAVCVSVHRSLDKLREPGAFKSWLYRIATYQCYEEERRWRKRSEKVVPFRQLRSEEDEEGNPQELSFGSSASYADQSLEQADLHEQIQAALGRLSPEQRAVLIMKEYEGLKFREIAEALNISENTVKSRLYYALQHLRKDLPTWQKIREQL